jgi:hypothetical protein
MNPSTIRLPGWAGAAAFRQSRSPLWRSPPAPSGRPREGRVFCQLRSSRLSTHDRLEGGAPCPSAPSCQVSPRPDDHAIALRIRTAEHPGRQSRLRRCAQPLGSTRLRPVMQPSQSFRLIANRGVAPRRLPVRLPARADAAPPASAPSGSAAPCPWLLLPPIPVRAGQREHRRSLPQSQVIRSAV